MGRDGEMGERKGVREGKRVVELERIDRGRENVRGVAGGKRRDREEGGDRGMEGTARDIAEDADVYSGTSEEWECNCNEDTHSHRVGR